MQTENQIKADAICELVNTMIGAFESGFVDTPNITLAALHRVAQNHIKYSYGIETPHIAEQWGEDFAKECGLGKEL